MTNLPEQIKTYEPILINDVTRFQVIFIDIVAVKFPLKFYLPLQKHYHKTAPQMCDIIQKYYQESQFCIVKLFYPDIKQTKLHLHF